MSDEPDQQHGEQADERAVGSRRQVWLGVALALVVIVALAVVSLTGGKAPAGPQAQPAAPGSSSQLQEQARKDAARHAPDDPLALGSATAPVTLVLWADFQCPYCAAFTKDTEPALITQYVNTGKARLEWRDFAFLGQESTLAAVAARAAGRQGKFWPYHDLLYAQQHPENSGALTRAYLVGLAGQLGLDLPRFEHDLTDTELARQVAADEKAGTAAGVNGTPTVLVNGQLIDGAEPLAEYQHAIDAALAQAAAHR